MKTENIVLMKQTRDTLKGNWVLVIGTLGLMYLITVAAENVPKVGGLISFILSGPFHLGASIFLLSLSAYIKQSLEFKTVELSIGISF